jgi:molybdate transport system substrate-binding protein
MARLILFLLLFLASAPVRAERAPVVLAAASLQEALTEAADAWAARGHARPVLSFAASSALARQIAGGAPADLFVSADEEWMADVVRRGRVRPGTLSVLAGNRLALVAPARSRVALRITPGFPLAKALGGGRLALADPAAVPAGRYARQALTALGVWRSVSGRIAPAENVRAALALVERSEVPLGIVYRTDARASAAVRIVGLFPADSHRPIRYPMAELKAGQSPDARAFRVFLSGEAGRAILRRYGFTAP